MRFSSNPWFLMMTKTGDGEHFHMTNDGDVRQIRADFWP